MRVDSLESERAVSRPSTVDQMGDYPFKGSSRARVYVEGYRSQS